jgi:hypothetical protein
MMNATVLLAATLSVKVLVQGIGSTGPAGTAILTQRPSGVDVIVKFPPRTSLNASDAIYKGNCTSPGAGRWIYKLRPLSNGISETTLHGVRLDKLLSGGYTVVVNLTPPLCGDLRTATPMRHPL